MGFLRARNDEQKQQRRAQILASANRLLDQYPYRDITMDMIAGGLHFSRANMARYVSTKEEIFLMLFIEDTEALVRDLTQTFTRREPTGIRCFAEDFMAVCADHINFMRLGAILTTIIEQNISPELLAGYKKTLYTEIDRVGGILAENFSFLTGESAAQFISMTVSYMAGSYPGANPTPVQAEAMRLCGMCPTGPRFSDAMVDFMVVTLNGFRALADQAEPAESE